MRRSLQVSMIVTMGIAFVVAANCDEGVYAPLPSGKWITLLQKANRGDPRAQNQVAIALVRGEGVVRDYAEAVRWQRKAAVAGYPVAQFNLGIMLYTGDGGQRDMAEAVRWFSNRGGERVARSAV